MPADVPGDLEVWKMITGNKKATAFWQEQHDFMSGEVGRFMESFQPRLLVNSWKKGSFPILSDWPFFPLGNSLKESVDTQILS